MDHKLGNPGNNALDFKKIFVINCQMEDIGKVLKSKTPHCSLHPNLTNSLIIEYRDLSCETTNASLRLPADLAIIFPKLEKFLHRYSIKKQTQNSRYILIKIFPQSYVTAVRHQTAVAAS